MTILLLGSFGFIGTNIIKYLDKYDTSINIIAFDRIPEHLAHVRFNNITKVYTGDISDENLLQRVFDENRIDIVIHSISASIPSLSLDNEFDIKMNVLPTIKLLNQMVKHKVNRIVFISSGGSIYGDHYVNPSGHVEDEVLFPKSAYGISKLIIEKYLYLYFLQHGTKSLILRLSNPYGPYHYSQKQGIINIALEKALLDEPFEIWGNGEGKKDYIYIEDFCSILMLLIAKWDQPYFVINVGSGQLYSANDIVETIKKTINSSFTWSYKDANKLDVQDIKLDLSNLRLLIGDYNFKGIREGIECTREWYEKNYHDK